MLALKQDPTTCQWKKIISHIEQLLGDCQIDNCYGPISKKYSMKTYSKRLLKNASGRVQTYDLSSRIILAHSQIRDSIPLSFLSLSIKRSSSTIPHVAFRGKTCSEEFRILLKLSVF
jgi:hypothetical protein